jgi:hypothetical protein
MKALNIKRGSTRRQGLLLVAAAAIVLCSSCATIQRHPVLTAVAVGLVAGSIAASADERFQPGSSQMPSFHGSCGRQCP